MSILTPIVAYLLAGAIYVVGDLKEHVVSQPAYIREYTQHGKMLPLVLAVFTWFPTTLLRRRFMPLFAFVLLAILGIYFSSI